MRCCASGRKKGCLRSENTSPKRVAKKSLIIAGKEKEATRHKWKAAHKMEHMPDDVMLSDIEGNRVSIKTLSQLRSGIVKISVTMCDLPGLV